MDKNAAGYTRSETICVIYLQRMKDAKRIYANLVYCKTNNDGFKKEGLTYPSAAGQIRLMDQFYKDIKLDPTSVDYVEGHSTGTKVGDPEECHTMDTVFCKGRKGPLLIGAVKSNCGHAEQAAAMCSFIKAILIFENQSIPPVINYNKPRLDCPALIEGRLKVVDTLQEFHGKLIGINAFGMGGSNAHALFKSCSKEKNNFGIPNDNLPRLVTWSGRTEGAINLIFNAITQKPLDSEFVALLQNTQTVTNNLNTYRGFGVFTQYKTENAKCIAKSVQNFSSSKRPIVFVYSGMGSQWLTMGTELMKIPIFEHAIKKCHDVLLPHGINLIEIITSKDPKIFDNILNSFVGINAIQIGITDILNAIGIKPDYIIGHSFGELACSYADNCTTAEETILSSYSRGMTSIETRVIDGLMAAIGIGHEQLNEFVPKEIEMACHNSEDSCTISGPAEIITNFVEKMEKSNYFAKIFYTANIAYHSKYIAEMGSNLLERLKKIIKNPKKRSKKWICSSSREENWESIQVQLSSAEYHTNNLLSPVLFQEAITHIPSDALTIEIAPYGLLHSILKRSLPDGIHFCLSQRKSEDNVLYLLNSLGK
jgi:fatty acid synthase, animal type